MATGDVTVTINPDGWTANLFVAGFTSGCSYAYGMSANNVPGVNTPFINATSLAFDNTGAATTAVRKVYIVPDILGNGPVRFPYSGASIPGTYTSGTFVDGETVTEAVTLATAVVVGPQGQSSGSALIVRSVTGSPTTAHAWTGGTSGAIFAQVGVITTFTTPSTSFSKANEEVTSTGVNIRVLLSDYVYQKDNSGGGNSGTAPTATIPASFITNTGGASQTSNALSGATVTNSSTIAYPKVIGHFAVANRLAVNGTEAIEFFAVHKYGTGGKPIAFLTMTATGASSGHTETGTATAMTLSARGDLIPSYAVSLNLSVGAGFTRGEDVSIRCTAKPWIGDSTAVLDSTTDAGSQIFQLQDLHRTIMSPMYARVDGVGAGTPTASATQSTADANPFATIALAAAGIASANNSSFSLNRVDGGEIQLNAGAAYTYVSSGTATNGCVTIKPHSSTNRAGVTLIQSSAANQSAYLRFYNITITRASNTYLIFAANPNYLVMESINFADVRTAWYSGDTNTAIDFIDCISSNGYFARGTNDGHSRLIRNMTYTATTETTGAPPAGNASCILGFHGSGGVNGMWIGLTSAGTSNFIIGYSTYYALTDGEIFTPGGNALSNWAVVNSVFERIGAAATPLADTDSYNLSNFGVAHCTWAGQRLNMENDWATPTNRTFTDVWGRFNSFNARGNHRADIRATNGAITGSWSLDNSVSWDSNHNEGISYTGDMDSWGTNSNFTAAQTSILPSVAAGYVADRSKGGTDAGNGDYHVLSAASVIAGKITGSASILPFDIAGTARSATDAAGAYHFSPAAGFFFR